MTTLTRTFSGAAAHMAGMTTTTVPATLAADALRQSTVTADYDATHERVNEVARLIAEQALTLTGGRRTYSWEGNGIRLTYTGDTVDDQGDVVFGPTVREYLVDGMYKTTAPTPSQSGTGLLNLALDHVKDCQDPIVDAKRQLVWLLLDPALDLVGYTMRTSTAWHGLMQSPHKLRTALAIRLAEVIEQKVLENPEGGLDLGDLLDGTNIVGYMVKTLDGAIFNLMKRIITNEAKHSTILDTPTEDGDAYRRPVADLDTEQLPVSAETAALEGAADRRALAILEAMLTEEEAVSAAKTANKAALASGECKTHNIRVRRGQEKAAIVARQFLAQTGLPTPLVPDTATRNQLVAELVEDDTLAYRAFMAWHNLLHGESGPRDGEVSDAWLSIWESYSPDDTDLMLTVIAGREERLSKVTAGVLTVPEPMSPTTKKRIRDTMKRAADHDGLNKLMAAAVDKYDQFIQGASPTGWEAAALTVLEHPHAPALRTVAELAAAFDTAAAALVY